jgi:hypothetical protein
MGFLDMVRDSSTQALDASSATAPRFDKGSISSLSSYDRNDQKKLDIRSHPARGFIVSADGTARCRNCGCAGRIPHHLSPIFWKFWSRDQLAALHAAMKADERLNWIAYRGAAVEDSSCNRRFLREEDGYFAESFD